MVARIVMISIGVFVLLCVMLFIAGSQSGNQGPQSDLYRYGRETNLISGESCCLIAKSEDDLIELIKMAQANDELSIRQMIIGGRVWSEVPGSRITVLGKGSYSTSVEVRFMDGKTGWIGPKMIQ